MANKKIGFYGKLESTANNKVENLYIIVNKTSIVFVIKHIVKNEFVSIEHFEQTEESNSWSPLLAYLQNNSKLIQNYYKNIFLVVNNNRIILSQTDAKDNLLSAAQELELIHGHKLDEEIYTSIIGDKHFLIYGIADDLYAILNRYFPSGKWQHYTSFFLGNEIDSEVQVRIFEDSFILYIVEKGITKLLNYYSLEGEDQNIYTLLNSCINAGIDINKFLLKVWGYEEGKHNFITKTAPYFAAKQVVQIEQVPNAYSSYFIF
ncbi:MAG: DUF3822 family protein [Chitinophagia bacterium]|nr:DUF3822 family protein [Chitinophagia bacterium]NDD16071.1 DUF3822 family protein [Chitinophagia bacterium]